jgi:5-methylcytosine-specific restriction endonuclease McrA
LSPGFYTRAPGFYTSDEVRLVYDTQRGRCAYCGRCLAAGYHVDHMTPVSRGGSNWLANIAVACQECNNAKFTKTAAQYFARLIRERRAERQAQAAV